MLFGNFMVRAAALSVAILCCLPLSAAIIQTNSSWTNDSAFATQLINKHPGWDDPYLIDASPDLWISHRQTGDPNDPGFIVVPNGTMVTFSTTFNLASLPSSAAVYAGCDDTCRLKINGNLVFDFATPIGNTYLTCSDFSPSCTTAKEILGLNVMSFLVAGVNTIEFTPFQGNLVSYGGSLTLQTSDVPEPWSMALTGIGFVVIGVLRHRQSRSS
jgi:hypothetical protein